MANEERVAIPRSALVSVVDACPSSPVPDWEPIEVTVVLRRNASQPDIGERLLAGTFRPVSREEAEKTTSSSPADVAAVEQFAEEYQLRVSAADENTRTVKLSGTASHFEQAFGVQLSNTALGRTYAGDLTVPCALDGVVIAVLGLDSRPVARIRANAV